MNLRLVLIARCAQLLRYKLSAASGRYSGAMVPNLQSIIDLCDALEADLPKLHKQILELELSTYVKS